MLEFRNAKYFVNNWIDCEINHPVYGWIPFTINPEDDGSKFDVAAFYKEVAATLPPPKP